MFKSTTAVPVFLVSSSLEDSAACGVEWNYKMFSFPFTELGPSAWKLPVVCVPRGQTSHRTQLGEAFKVCGSLPTTARLQHRVHDPISDGGVLTSWPASTSLSLYDEKIDIQMDSLHTPVPNQVTLLNLHLTTCTVTKIYWSVQLGQFLKHSWWYTDAQFPGSSQER